MMDQKPVVICVKSRSARCWRAMRLLRRKGYAFNVVQLPGDDEIPSRLVGAVGRSARKLPLVLVDGRLVGGYGVIKALDRSGDLDRLVRGEV